MSLIDDANAKVSIATVCAMYGMDVSGVPDGRSIKTYCPFGDLYHSDGGMERTFRIYPETNSAFCFRGCGPFSAVTLASKFWDVNPVAAAKRLLEEMPEEDPDLKWKKLSAPETKVIEVSSLAKALELYCIRLSPKAFDDPQVRTKFDRMKGVLEYVDSPERADQWLTAGQAAMREILGEGDGDS